MEQEMKKIVNRMLRDRQLGIYSDCERKNRKLTDEERDFFRYIQRVEAASSLDDMEYHLNFKERLGQWSRQ